MQILEARVHARQQIGLLNGHMFSLHLRQRYHCLHFIGAGHVRNYGRQIEFEFDRVVGIHVGAQVAAIAPPRINVGVGVAGATLGAARSRAPGLGQLTDARVQIIHRHFIKWKHAGERAPFGRHVGDGHARGHGKIRYGVAHEFHRVIKYLVFVEQSAQRDDDILAGNARGKISFQHYLGDLGNLPPRDAGRPNTRGIGSHHRRAQRGDGAVQIGM